ncbi:MAG: hypothetical protein GF309_03120 [Candidatus Lokiarchaeota archaeon]|nr:hypothetical protein [Candidatus Lokiarchaeota archaeon]
MVSRSLEKMLLIAVGLSSAVIVGVPLLMHAVNLMAGATRFEMAQQAANQIHNATEEIDMEQANRTTVQFNAPEGFAIQVQDNKLTITYSQDGEIVGSWPHTYSHSLLSTGFQGRGNYVLTIRLVDEVVHLSFNHQE